MKINFSGCLSSGHRETKPIEGALVPFRGSPGPLQREQSQGPGTMEASWVDVAAEEQEVFSGTEEQVSSFLSEHRHADFVSPGSRSLGVQGLEK